MMKTKTLIDKVYSEMVSHYRMLQATAHQEHERCIIMRAALDPEDKDEAHELSFKADNAYAKTLQYERDILQIMELWEDEKTERKVEHEKRGHPQKSIQGRPGYLSGLPEAGISGRGLSLFSNKT